MELKQITQEKLVDMTAVIINALKNADNGKNKVDWDQLEQEWLEWLEEELTNKK